MEKSHFQREWELMEPFPNGTENRDADIAKAETCLRKLRSRLNAHQATGRCIKRYRKRLQGPRRPASARQKRDRATLCRQLGQGHLHPEALRVQGFRYKSLVRVRLTQIRDKTEWLDRMHLRRNISRRGLVALADGGRTASTTTIELGEGIHAFWDAIWNVTGPYDRHNPTIVDWVKRVWEEMKELDPEETRWSTGWYQAILKQKPWKAPGPGQCHPHQSTRGAHLQD